MERQQLYLFLFLCKVRLTACGDDAGFGGEENGGDGGDVEVVADVSGEGGVVALDERHFGRHGL
jgi:hypothetical protein